MCRIWINAAIIFSAVAALGGCATSKTKLLTHDDHTMLDIWRAEIGGQRGGASRPLPQRPLCNGGGDQRVAVDNSNYTRTAQNEITRQFQRLPNPDLVMYVFPHLAGSELVPVPGYSTVFPFYQRVQYALPGERVEDF